MSKLIKFRKYNHLTKDFCYNSGEGDIQQFIGILDKNMKEIYEHDVVRFKTGTKKDIGVIRYFNCFCSYVVEVDDGYDLFCDILFDSLEVVGNMIEDYMYNEKGELAKRETLS